MSIFILTDAVIWAHDFNLTTNTNKTTLKTASDDKEANVFGMAGYKQRVAGLESVELSVNGYASNTGDVDASLFPGLGVPDRLHSAAATSTAGSTAYFFQGALLDYERLGAVNEVAPLSLDAKGSNATGLMRGQVALPSQLVNATGSFTGVNLGSAFGKRIYAGLHIFGTPGTTVTLVVESAPTNAFASTTTQITLGPLTTAGGTFTSGGPVLQTDPWWRYRVTAITGSFTMAGSLAIR